MQDLLVSASHGKDTVDVVAIAADRTIISKAQLEEESVSAASMHVEPVPFARRQALVSCCCPPPHQKKNKALKREMA